MKTLRITFSVLAFAAPLAAQDRPPGPVSSRYADKKTGLSAAAVTIDLPAGASWSLDPLPGDSPLKQAVLEPLSREDPLDEPEGSEPKKREAPPVSVKYTVLGLLPSAPDKPVTLTFSSNPPGQTHSIQWKPGAGKQDAGILGRWAVARAQRWISLGPPDRSSITSRWLRSAGPVYQAPEIRWPGSGNLMEETAGPGDTDPMDTLAVFGGRCAVSETLQMQDINGVRGAEGQGNGKAVKLADLPRVKVKSHPFAEMAKGLEVPAMPLASMCPPDRFFAFFPQPGRIRTVIDRLGEASDRFSASSEGMLDYQLWQKYLARLGLEEEMVRKWIEAGRAQSVAFFLPDLFIRDATDITFLIQMKEGGGPQLFNAMPETDSALTLPGKGGQCHVLRRGNVLIVSTSASEAELAAKLAAAGGKGSLGESDEFRCMRSKLPDSAKTVAYCYFSDPFIRRLTGPEVKIPQSRRSAARERMEAATAAALLYQLDHGKPAPDLKTLIDSGYAFVPPPPGWRDESKKKQAPADAGEYFKDITLGEGPVAVSGAWGSLADLKPLSANPVTEVTVKEAQMYRTYVQRYEEFWRRYFDPIAIRLDETAPGAWSVSTFVLPLVDNSLYSGLKSAIDPSRPAALPAITPAIPAIAAVSLKPEVLRDSGIDSPRFLAIAKSGASGLTGRMAIAFPDADPILQAGGAAGVQQLGSLIASDSGGMNGMGGIGLLIAVVTRPVDLFFEVKSESEALALVEAAASAATSSWVRVRRVTREGENRRLYCLDFEQLAQIHFSAAVENGWLHISNHPWSSPLKVTGTEPQQQSSAVIRIDPAAINAGAPSAQFQAQNAWRDRILAACSDLLPWMDAQGLDTAGAQKQQLVSLGSASLLPAGVNFVAGAELTAPPVLSREGETVSAAEAKTDHGILEGLRGVTLRTNFEEGGLRAELEWIAAP